VTFIVGCGKLGSAFCHHTVVHSDGTTRPVLILKPRIRESLASETDSDTKLHGRKVDIVREMTRGVMVIRFSMCSR
jgi:hypothetical protein